jgi:dolichol-phosphate mannosyltransferase
MLHDGLAQALPADPGLIVVDDDSPDGTADVVRRLGLQRDNVRCLQRVQDRVCAPPSTGASGGAWRHRGRHGWGSSTRSGPVPGCSRHCKAARHRVGLAFLAGGRAARPVVGLRQTLSDYGNRLTNLLLGKQLTDPLTGFFARRAGCS